MNILVFGAGGFIGHHLVTRLKQEGHWVCGVDLKYPEFTTTSADEFIIGDLSVAETYSKLPEKQFDQIFQLAADMGGAEYIFTGAHDSDVMTNSVLINLYTLKYVVDKKIKKIFYSSSACVYPAYNQTDPDNPICTEHTAYPAAPDSEYGWEKLFSERLYLTYAKNHNVEVRIARYHNIYGPEGTWQGGKEKAPAAICRKVAQCKDNGDIEIFGSGKQTRSFLYIDDCIDCTLKLMASDYGQPINIGSEEMVSIDQLVDIVISVSTKSCNKVHIPGPTGVMGRSSDNTLCKQVLAWEPSVKLIDGITKTYSWINEANQGKLV